MKRDVIVAIGMFDGVHAGHRFMLGELVKKAKDMGCESMVVTFGNHPRGVINGAQSPRLLTDVEEKVRLIRERGVDNVIVMRFDEGLRRLTAREFVERNLMGENNARGIMIGYDNGFGSDRLRGVEAYRTALSPLGIEVYECAEYEGEGVSSSKIREALRAGDAEKAAKMLGRPYEVVGKVVKGKQLGRQLGFPTANILPNKELLLPKGGVYAGVMIRPKGLAGLPVMVNIGKAPTVNGSEGEDVSVEAHIIADSGIVPDLYGAEIGVGLVKRLRDEERFPDLASLKAALSHDREETVRIIRN